MKRMAFIMAMMLIIALALTACEDAQAVYGKEHTDIEAKTGETFTIKLEENPTTGYQWSIAVSDESVVMLDKDDYEPDDQSGELVGSGGTRVLTFKALKAGTATIGMVYERSWEPNPDDAKVQFSVTVS